MSSLLTPPKGEGEQSRCLELEVESTDQGSAQLLARSVPFHCYSFWELNVSPLGDWDQCSFSFPQASSCAGEMTVRRHRLLQFGFSVDLLPKGLLSQEVVYSLLIVPSI